MGEGFGVRADDKLNVLTKERTAIKSADGDEGEESCNVVSARDYQNAAKRLLSNRRGDGEWEP